MEIKTTIKSGGSLVSHLKALLEIQRGKVAVGIFAAAGDENLTKALVNEFGTNKAGKNKNITIPERSFLRSTYNDEVGNVTKRFQQIYKKVSAGNTNVKQMLGVVGLEQEKAVKQKITDLKTPANAAITIASKGSSNPLIDTGEMRSKIASEVRLK